MDQELVSVSSNSTIQNFFKLLIISSSSSSFTFSSSSSQIRQLLTFVLITSGVKPHRIENALSLLQNEISTKKMDDSANEETKMMNLIRIIADVVARRDELKENTNSKNKKQKLFSKNSEASPSPHLQLPFHRIARSISIYTKQRSLIVFVGGPSGAGKSTLASQLASRLNITSVLSTDSIREALRSNAAAVKSCPELSSSTFDARISSATTTNQVDPAFHVLSHFHKQCAAILSVMEKYIEERAIRNGESVIIEGVHLVPAWIRMIMERYYNNNNYGNSSSSSSSSPPQPIIVPVFAFVGGSTRHMHRFSWRRNKQQPQQEPSGEKQDSSPTTPLSPSTTTMNSKNRYLNNFDQIRMIHHWFLSEIGKWFLHDDIGDYCDGGVDFHHLFLANNENYNKNNYRPTRATSPEKGGGKGHEGDNEHEDEDKHEEEEDPSSSSFPRSTSSTCLMLRTISTENNNAATTKQQFQQQPQQQQQKSSPSRLWFRWRRRANIVVKLVRSSQNSNNNSDDNNQNDDEKGNRTSLSSRSNISNLTPVLDNVNLDRSVNSAHQAVQMWLDAEDLQSTCLHALPEVSSSASAEINASLMARYTSDEMNTNNNNNTSFSSPNLLLATTTTSAIATALQKRRQEKGGMLHNYSNRSRKISLKKKIDEEEQNNTNNYYNQQYDYGTSSGEDCGGSVGRESCFEDEEEKATVASTSSATTTSE